MSNSFQRWCPTDIFNTGQAGTTCEVKDIFVSLTAATNNQQVVPAVTGKKIVVIGGVLKSSGAAGVVAFKSASAGTFKRSYQVPVNTAATPNVELPLAPWGNFRTVSGEGLFADNTSAATIEVSLTYIEV